MEAEQTQVQGSLFPSEAESARVKITDIHLNQTLPSSSSEKHTNTTHEPLPTCPNVQAVVQPVDTVDNTGRIGLMCVGVDGTCVLTVTGRVRRRRLDLCVLSENLNYNTLKGQK